MRLVAEAAKSAWARPVASVVSALIVASVCTGILLTEGQTIAARRSVLSQIDAVGTRSIVITDVQGTAGMKADSVSRVSNLSGIEWVVGIGPAVDVKPVGMPFARGVALRPIYGKVPGAVNIRELEQGQALVGRDAQIALGMLNPVGSVTDLKRTFPVVGGFQLSEPLEELNRGLLTGGHGDDDLRVIYVLVESPQDVSPLRSVIVSVLGAQDASALSITTSEILAEVRAAVSDDLVKRGRILVLTVLAAGLALTSISVYGAVAGRRLDFGRRRALGASRTTVAILVVAQTVLTSLLGAVVGVLASVGVMLMRSGQPVDLDLAISVGVLAVIAGCIAAVPPAWAAAAQDPVTALRKP